MTGCSQRFSARIRSCSIGLHRQGIGRSRSGNLLGLGGWELVCEEWRASEAGLRQHFDNGFEARSKELGVARRLWLVAIQALAEAERVPLEAIRRDSCEKKDQSSLIFL